MEANNFTINPDCCWHGAPEITKYLDVLTRRKLQYKTDIDNRYTDTTKSLNVDGYSVINSFIEKDRLLSVKNEFEEIKNSGELQYNDFYTEQVAHPLLNCKSVSNIAFDDRIINIAKNFFGCMPVLNNVQLRKSKATNMQESSIPGNGSTTLFHCDKNSPRFLKFFFYLDDVGPKNGPFTYVEGSHIKKFSGWKNKLRWTQEEIESKYGTDKIKTFFGMPGDLIIANTNGFHKGMKITEGERLLLVLFYNIHPTEWRKSPPWSGMMKKQTFDSLPEWKKPLADYINKV